MSFLAGVTQPGIDLAAQNLFGGELDKGGAHPFQGGRQVLDESSQEARRPTCVALGLGIRRIGTLMALRGIRFYVCGSSGRQE